jgi:DNA segregation ATPase FtsK/SpoIIIE, S-DNA-T family
MKRRIETALGLLLSQGRTVGVVIVGAVQDPRKDVLPQRDLLTIRIGLRLNEAEHVQLVLGPGARNRGATCDLIPHSLPGVGYVEVDGVAEPVRVRFPFHSWDTITALGQSSQSLTVVQGPVLEGIAA